MTSFKVNNDATSITVKNDGSITIERSNLNTNLNAKAGGIIPRAKVVVLRPNQTPKVEEGYEVQIANNQANLRPLKTVDQEFEAGEDFHRLNFGKPSEG